MKIDSAIKLFSEKYNREAIQSIDDISKDYGLNITEATIKGFDIAESFDTFANYLEGYSSFRINSLKADKPLSDDEIKTSVNKFINTKVFSEAQIKYQDLPGFVTGYINGINSLCETVDNLKREMLDNDVDPEHVGMMNEFVDMFMDRLDESFDTTMDTILWASGYNSKQRLSKSNTNKAKAPQFL